MESETRGADRVGSALIFSPERRELESKLAMAGCLLEATEGELFEARRLLEKEQSVVAELRSRCQNVRASECAQAGDHLEELVILSRLLREQEAIAQAAIIDRDERCYDAYDLLVQQMKTAELAQELSSRKIGWLRVVLAAVIRSLLLRKRAAFGPVGALMDHLRKEGLFDERRYLSMYGDVANTGINPLLHYVKHGMDEGRQAI